MSLSHYYFSLEMVSPSAMMFSIVYVISVYWYSPVSHNFLKVLNVLCSAADHSQNELLLQMTCLQFEWYSYYLPNRLYLMRSLTKSREA